MNNNENFNNNNELNPTIPTSPTNTNIPNNNIQNPIQPNTTNNINQTQQNIPNSERNTPPQKKINLIIIVIAVIICLFIIIKIFGGKSNDNGNLQNNSYSNNQSIYTTVSGKDFWDATDENYYKQFIGKKITITDLTIYQGSMMYKTGLSVTCKNESSLSLTEGTTVSVTGNVEDNFTNSTYSLTLSNCTIN